MGETGDSGRPGPDDRRGSGWWPYALAVGGAMLAAGLLVALVVALATREPVQVGTVAETRTSVAPPSAPPSTPRPPPAVQPVPPRAVDPACVTGPTVTSPGGSRFNTLSCRTENTGFVYADASEDTTVGYIESTQNWFACQGLGATSAYGGRVWLYTQADDRYSNDGWGWYPAAAVQSEWAGVERVPGLVDCLGPA